MPTIASLKGLWQRSLLAWPDGRQDTTTAVYWLQGPGLYADLRQPAGRPDFAGIPGLDGTDRARLAWLAGQEGFAGELGFTDGFFEWRRDLDFQPATAFADAGRLWFEGDVLMEEGRDLPYVEHWHRHPAPAQPCAAARLVETGGSRRGFLVRCGDLFLHARDRAVAVTGFADLGAAVAAADDSGARALLDFNLSFGTISAAGWIVSSSSLPFLEGTSLAPARAPDGLTTWDIARDGTPVAFTWTIDVLQGALDDLVDFTAPRATALSR